MDEVSDSDVTDEPQRFRCPDCGTATFQLAYRGAASGDELAEAPAQLAAMLAAVARDSPICVECSNHDCSFKTAVTDIELAFAAGGCLSKYFRE